MGKRELYLEALRHDPRLAAAYHNLGLTLAPGERVTLPDSRVMGKD
jgi:hypothetical protein